MSATTRINVRQMTASQIATAAAERYGRDGGAKYLRTRIESAGMANYAKTYERALAILVARASLVTYPVTRTDGRVVNVTIPQD